MTAVLHHKSSGKTIKSLQPYPILILLLSASNRSKTIPVFLPKTFVPTVHARPQELEIGSWIE